MVKHAIEKSISEILGYELHVSDEVEINNGCAVSFILDLHDSDYYKFRYLYKTYLESNKLNVQEV
jgi:hypothetical protein